MRRSLTAVVATAVLAAAVTIVAQADVVTGGNARVSFQGAIEPRLLPRVEPAPIALDISGSVKPIGDLRPEGIRRVEIAINRHGIVSTHGLPVCPRRRLLSNTSRDALAACRGALVGSGHFRAHIDIPEQSPFPAIGRLLVFNARVGGHRALLGHVYGTRPVPNAEVLPMAVRRERDGQFGSTLIVTMPRVGDDWGYVTGFDLRLEREYRFRGRVRSFLSASCPAPDGVRDASFRAARGTFFLSAGDPVTRIVTSHCRVDDR